VIKARNTEVAAASVPNTHASRLQMRRIWAVDAVTVTTSG